MMTLRDCCRAYRDRGAIPFVPAIYEHKAALINRTPAEVCCNLGRMNEAHAAEWNTYRSPVQVVGLDVYNIEAEAMGCTVHFPKDSFDVPVCVTPVLDADEDPTALLVPDPEQVGRMPLMLETALHLKKHAPSNHLILGAVSGPMSLASELVGMEKLMMAMLTDPEWAQQVLDKATETSLRFARAFFKRGVGVSIFDSRATPDLLSPTMYREQIFPHHSRLVSGLRDKGTQDIGLIVGGNTTPIVEDLLSTGATHLIADWTANLPAVLEAVSGTSVVLRLNLNPALFVKGTDADWEGAAQQLLERIVPYPNAILGTGVLPWNAEPSRLQHISTLAEHVGQSIEKENTP